MKSNMSRIPDMKSGGGLKPKAYTAIEKLMIERFGVEFTKDKIKNKLKYTKPNLTVMKEMLNTSGFGYDPINKCIEVDAQVWNDYIQRYPSRKKYRGPKVWRYYDEFVEVYDDSNATGQNAVTLNSVLPDVTEPLPSTPASQTSPSYMQFDSEQSFAQMQNDDSPLQSPLPTTPTTEIPTNNTSSHQPSSRRIVHSFRDAGTSFVQLMLYGHPRNCLDLLRMEVHTYMRLCNILRDRNLLEDVRDITEEEQVAMLLLTNEHNERNRAVQNTFQHSGQTISKYVSLVLRAICILGKDYVRRSNDEMPAHIPHSKRFFPYFENCLGAIDGTHIPAWVPASDQARFRNRKGFVSQNVMAVVGLDTRFHYVMAGWEGSATDSRVLYNALDHETDPFVVSEGKYYIADGGYPNIQGLLTPYRGHHYHMSEFNTRGAHSPRTEEELFNHRHSSL
ncbi:hypothetical protein EJ110_NYTH09430 [Nymphaea thermarum]|nr:hypothetical protein EJ110_NYTH09430 [Nymphaea thermarum]